MVGAHDRFRKTAGFDLDETADGYVIYDKVRDRVHFLNATAAIVLELCTGTRTATDIAATVEQTFSLPQRPVGAVDDCLTSLLSEGLIEPCERS
jgi:hypothetical protein